MNRLKPSLTKKVLLVEDDLQVGEMLTSALRHVGCQVELAHSRDRALKIIQDGFQPDLILLDYHMPGMSAADFMTEIVAKKPLPRIVLMSADRDARELAQKIGVPEVVEKPFDPFDIL